jgi:hypothetical protein
VKTKIFFIFLLLFFSFLISRKKELGVDFYHHLKTGELIFKTKSFPYFDFYSHTSIFSSWIDHEWGFQLLIYVIKRFLGDVFLFSLKFFLISLIFLILFFFIYHKNKNIFISFLLTLFVMCGCSEFLTLRPQLFTFLFLLFFEIILDNFYNEKSNHLFLIPFITIFWANLHSGFIAGIILFLIYLFSEIFFKNYEKIKNYSIFLFFTILVTFLNPYFHNLYILIYHNITSPLLLRNIREWFSPDFHLPSNYLFEIFILLILFSFWISEKKIKIVYFLMLIFLLHISLFAVRNIPIFMLLFSPILGELLWRKFIFFENLESSLEKTWIPLIISVFILTFIIFNYPKGNFEEILIKENFYPEKAIEFIKIKKFKPNMFNDYNWGGYLIYKLPEYKVFIDGRIITVYSKEVISDYEKVVKLKEDWKEILNKYKINFVLISKNQPLAEILKESKDWQILYSDYLAEIFERAKK